MSKLDKIIKEEIGLALKEGFSDRAEAILQGISDVPQRGSDNKQIMRAQSILGTFLKKIKNLEQETEDDLDKLQLDRESAWLKDIFDRYSKIHNVMAHVKAIVDASPDDIRNGNLTEEDGPNTLDKTAEKEMEMSTVVHKQILLNMIMILSVQTWQNK